MIIATSGCFLHLHEGHKDLIRWLDYLSSQEDIIHIAVNSSVYLDEKKGKKVPESMGVRLGMVQKTVREIMPTKNTRISIDDNILPHLKALYRRQKIIWIVGNDYLDKDFKEKELADCIVFTKRLGISSTQIEEDENGREILDSSSSTRPRLSSGSRTPE